MSQHHINTAGGLRGYLRNREASAGPVPSLEKTSETLTPSGPRETNEGRTRRALGTGAGVLVGGVGALAGLRAADTRPLWMVADLEGTLRLWPIRREVAHAFGKVNQLVAPFVEERAHLRDEYDALARRREAGPQVREEFDKLLRRLDNVKERESRALSDLLEDPTLRVPYYTAHHVREKALWGDRAWWKKLLRPGADVPQTGPLPYRSAVRAGVFGAGALAGGALANSLLSRSKTSEVTTPLRPHQERVRERLREQPGLVIAHGLGSGKTLSSIAIAEDLGGDATVVLPAALQANYEKEIDRHVTAPRRARFLIESLQRAALRRKIPEGDVLIVDEAHRLRNPDAEGVAAILKGAKDFDKRVLLTGTPVYNHPMDVAPLVNAAAGAKLLPTQKREFEQRFMREVAVKPPLLRRLMGAKPVMRKELKNTAELEQILGEWVDFQRNSKEGFPSTREEEVRVPLSREQWKHYQYHLGTLDPMTRWKIEAGLPVSKQESPALNTFANAVRQIANTERAFVYKGEKAPQVELSPKHRAALERLEARLRENPDHRAVVYSHYLDSGLVPYSEELTRRGIAHGLFTGDQPKAVRDQMVRDYNAGKLKALLLSSAGGEGLDLKGTRQIQALEPHFNDAKIQQVIGRGVRYGSHAALPEDQREVLVERYLATLPERRGLARLFSGRARGNSIDEYLLQMSADKADLAGQVEALMERQTQAREAARLSRRDHDLQKASSLADLLAKTSDIDREYDFAQRSERNRFYREHPEVLARDADRMHASIGMGSLAAAGLGMGALALHNRTISPRPNGMDADAVAQMTLRDHPDFQYGMRTEWDSGVSALADRRNERNTVVLTDKGPAAWYGGPAKPRPKGPHAFMLNVPAEARFAIDRLGAVSLEGVGGEDTLRHELGHMKQFFSPSKLQQGFNSVRHLSSRFAANPYAQMGTGLAAATVGMSEGPESHGPAAAAAVGAAPFAPILLHEMQADFNAARSLRGRGLKAQIGYLARKAPALGTYAAAPLAYGGLGYMMARGSRRYWETMQDKYDSAGAATAARK